MESILGGIMWDGIENMETLSRGISRYHGWGWLVYSLFIIPHSYRKNIYFLDITSLFPCYNSNFAVTLLISITWGKRCLWELFLEKENVFWKTVARNLELHWYLCKGQGRNAASCHSPSFLSIAAQVIWILTQHERNLEIASCSCGNIKIAKKTQYSLPRASSNLHTYQGP